MPLPGRYGPPPVPPPVPSPMPGPEPSPIPVPAPLPAPPAAPDPWLFDGGLFGVSTPGCSFVSEGALTTGATTGGTGSGFAGGGGGSTGRSTGRTSGTGGRGRGGGGGSGAGRLIARSTGTGLFSALLPFALSWLRWCGLLESAAATSATWTGLDEEDQSSLRQPLGHHSGFAASARQPGAEPRRAPRAGGSTPSAEWHGAVRAEARTEELACRRRSRLEAAQQKDRANSFVRTDQPAVTADDPPRLDERRSLVERSSSGSGDFPRREDLVRRGGGLAIPFPPNAGQKTCRWSVPGPIDGSLRFSAFFSQSVGRAQELCSSGTAAEDMPGILADMLEPMTQQVIVTGASSGIGRAAAIRFGQAGASVLAVGRDQSALDEVVAAIVDDGGRAAAFQADVTEASAPERIVGAALERLGGLTTVVNAAGIIGSGHDRIDDRRRVGHDDGHQRARAVSPDARRVAGARPHRGAASSTCRA